MLMFLYIYSIQRYVCCYTAMPRGNCSIGHAIQLTVIRVLMIYYYCRKMLGSIIVTFFSSSRTFPRLATFTPLLKRTNSIHCHFNCAYFQLSPVSVSLSFCLNYFSVSVSKSVITQNFSFTHLAIFFNLTDLN